MSKSQLKGKDKIYFDTSTQKKIKLYLYMLTKRKTWNLFLYFYDRKKN